MKGVKYNLVKFIAEFILIVTGIILSFYIQGKIEERDSRIEAKHILEQVLTDMVSDTIRFNHSIQVANHTIGCTFYLLNLDYITNLDTDEEIDSAMFCFWPTTSNLKTPVHTAGYTRLLHFEHENVIRNDNLVNSIIGYYTIDKAALDGCMKFDADFVDGRLTDAYTESYSYEVLNAAYNGKPYSATIKEDIILFLQNKKIRALLIFNNSNKYHFMENIVSAKANACRNIELLKTWLAQP